MAFQSKAIHGYNQVSQGQLQVAMKYTIDVVESLKKIESLKNDKIQIVDYGCSEGKNSIIVFSEALKLFRDYYSIPVSILHTDLPENNWGEVHKLINQSTESYLKHPNIFYSTVGRSFFDQIVPEGYVNLGYSSYAMNYMSYKPTRNLEDYGRAFPNSKKQGTKDLTYLLNLRIKELAIGGHFVMIFSAREKLDQDPSISKYSFESVKSLLNKRIITEKEFKNYVWPTYPFQVQEIQQIFEQFQDQVEIIKLEYGKIPLPYYAEFLIDKNKEKYKSNMMYLKKIMMKNALFAALNRTEEEKEKIFEKSLKEIEIMIDGEIAE